MEADGDTVADPFGWTTPMPVMETSVAFVVRHVKVADPPRGMLSGSVQIEADWSAVGADSAVLILPVLILPVRQAEAKSETLASYRPLASLSR